MVEHAGYQHRVGGTRSVYAPGARLDLGEFAIIPLIAGFYVGYLNLDEVLAPGVGNQMEKGLLFLAPLLFIIARPISPARVFLLLAFAAIPALSLIGTDFLYAGFGRFIRGFLSYMAPWMILSLTLEERLAKRFLIAVSLAPLFSVSLGFVYETIGVWKSFHYSYDGANRLQGSTIPAFLAGGAALATFSSMICARYYDQRYMLLALVNLAILALTGGRMALAIALLSVGFLVLTRYRITAALVIQAVGGVTAMVVAAFSLFPDLISRLSDSGDSGRGQLWEVVQRVWDAHPYFGIGLGHQGMIVPESVSKWVTTTAAHNEYLRLGCEIGWVGMILLGLTYAAFVLVNTFHWPKRGDPLFALMCLLFLLFCYSDNALSQPTMFGLMVVAYVERFVGVGRPARIAFNPFRKTPPEGYGRLA